MKIYVPADSTALAAGAEAVARALSAEARRLNVEIDIVRTGSRGLYWLEPLIEIDSEGGRIGFGPLNPADVASLLEGRLGAHPKALGLVEEIPFLKRQQRLVFERCGVIDPLSLDDYRGHGGLEGSVMVTVTVVPRVPLPPGATPLGGPSAAAAPHALRAALQDCIAETPSLAPPASFACSLHVASRAPSCPPRPASCSPTPPSGPCHCKPWWFLGVATLPMCCATGAVMSGAAPSS